MLIYIRSKPAAHVCSTKKGDVKLTCGQIGIALWVLYKRSSSGNWTSNLSKKGCMLRNQICILILTCLSRRTVPDICKHLSTCSMSCASMILLESTAHRWHFLKCHITNFAWTKMSWMESIFSKAQMRWKPKRSIEDQKPIIRTKSFGA